MSKIYKITVLSISLFIVFLFVAITKIDYKQPQCGYGILNDFTTNEKKFTTYYDGKETSTELTENEYEVFMNVFSRLK